MRTTRLALALSVWVALMVAISVAVPPRAPAGRVQAIQPQSLPRYRVSPRARNLDQDGSRYLLIADFR